MTDSKHTPRLCYRAVESNGRMYVMKPDGSTSIAMTAKFDVVTEPNILREEAAFVADALNRASAHDDLVDVLSDFIDYSGGAAHACADEYLMDRARAALAKAGGA